MLLADTMAWVFAILGLMLALPGLWLLCRGLWPATVERTTEDCGKGLLFPFLCGIPLAVLTVVLANIVNKAPGALAALLPIAVISIFVLFASTGVAGLATTIGRRLPSPADENTPWRATIRGGVVLELAYLPPFLGWFLILPASLIIGAGAALRSIIKGWRDGQALKNVQKKPAEPKMETRPPEISVDGTVGA
jgi:hypothetical protein